MTKYKVTASSLNVREEPKLTAKVIGYLSLDEIVEGVSISGDGYWYKIKRDDGLEGWSSHKFLVAYEGEIEGEEFPWMPIALPEVASRNMPARQTTPGSLSISAARTLDLVLDEVAEVTRSSECK